MDEPTGELAAQPWIIRSFTIEDHAEALALWDASPGVGLSTADAAGPIATYLARNPDSSLVAVVDDQLVGTVLAGHDGRRGYIYHLAVREGFRRRGIGRALATEAIARLSAQGIVRTHLFVYHDNLDARTFWRRLGWAFRDELAVFTFDHRR